MVNYKDPEIRARHSLHLDVAAFHHKFGLLLSEQPTHLTKRKLQERFECMLEELNEFRDAAKIDSDEPQDLALMADALVDLVYFAMGTSAMMGLPFGDLWADVHNANMRKIRGISHRGHAVDCIKPAGWVGPQGLSILQAYGYSGYISEEHCLDDEVTEVVVEEAAPTQFEPVPNTSPVKTPADDGLLEMTHIDRGSGPGETVVDTTTKEDAPAAEDEKKDEE